VHLLVMVSRLAWVLRRVGGGGTCHRALGVGGISSILLPVVCLFVAHR
jgi:hypothetical protein